MPLMMIIMIFVMSVSTECWRVPFHSRDVFRRCHSIPLNLIHTLVSLCAAFVLNRIHNTLLPSTRELVVELVRIRMATVESGQGYAQFTCIWCGLGAGERNERNRRHSARTVDSV